MRHLIIAAVVAGGLLTPLAGLSTDAGSGARSGLPSVAPAVGPVAAAPAVAYVAPLAGALQVLQPFTPPSTPYGPGHLGVDLVAGPGTAVRSAGPGIVTFAGLVAGRGVLVVAHPDGIRTEYEPVRALVRRGAPVLAGEVIGRIAGRHRSCASRSCVHWGARRGTVYLDPLALLRPLAPVRLLPWPAGGR